MKLDHAERGVEEETNGHLPSSSSALPTSARGSVTSNLEAAAICSSFPAKNEDGGGRRKSSSSSWGETGKNIRRLCLQFLVPTLALCTVVIGIIVSILRGVFERHFIDDMTEIVQSIILHKMKVYAPPDNASSCAINEE